MPQSSWTHHISLASCCVMVSFSYIKKSLMGLMFVKVCQYILPLCAVILAVSFLKLCYLMPRNRQINCTITVAMFVIDKLVWPSNSNCGVTFLSSAGDEQIQNAVVHRCVNQSTCHQSSVLWTCEVRGLEAAAAHEQLSGRYHFLPKR